MFKTFAEILQTEEELHPDLQKYLDKRTSIGPVLRHPLVISLMHHPSQNAFVNQQYLQKKEVLQEKLRDNELEGYVFLHERPYRLNAFLDIVGMLEDKKYWSLLGSIWIDSENIWQDLPTWKSLLKSKRPEKDNFMTEEDRKTFKELTDEVVAFRGHIKGKNKKGLSYTLSKEKAEWFAKRFHTEGEVMEVKVPKKKVFAYLGGREEHEVIIL